MRKRIQTNQLVRIRATLPRVVTAQVVHLEAESHTQNDVRIQFTGFAIHKPIVPDATIN